MRLFARLRRDVVVAVVLGIVLGGALVVAVSADLFGSRPRPGTLLDFDLATGRLRFALRAQTASVHVHALGRGVVVVTGADSCDYRPDHETMYAYSLPAGSLRWQRALAGACGDAAEADPIGDGTVATFTRTGIEGWDASTGRTRWRLRLLGDDLRQSASAIVSVSSIGDRVRFIAADRGRVVRTAVVHHQPFVWAVTPAVVVLATLSSGGQQQLAAIDARSGRRLWRETVGGEGGFSLPRAADGVTIVGTIPGSTSNTATDSAYDIRTGRLLWRRQHRSVSTASSGDVQALGAGLALIVEDDTLQALDSRTGVMRWKRRLIGWRPDGSSQIVAGAGSVAVIDQAKVTVLDARDGATHWLRRLPTAALRAHEPAVIDDGQLLIPSISAEWKPYDE
jgi:outer membrane protein assembly factor BamB